MLIPFPPPLFGKESGRAKTREELLAEERDYKRRRASYRGKKVNRNPTEVHAKFVISFSSSAVLMLSCRLQMISILFSLPSLELLEKY